MKDSAIIGLYWNRDPEAIPATAKKYGSYCMHIALRILNSREDAEECVNDLYLNVWNSIPPHRPEKLSAYLGKLTRNLAYNRWSYLRAEKRGGGELPLVLEELGECVSGKDDVENRVIHREVLAQVNGFLRSVSRRKRIVFLKRYWYAEPIAEISREMGMTEGGVAILLSRMRRELRDYLMERGFIL